MAKSWPRGTTSSGAMGGSGGPTRLEAFGVRALHSFRPLQVHEVLQRRLAERQQAELHPGRVAPRLVRHVRPAHERRGSDGREQVLDHGPMHHLLAGDVEEHPAPPLDDLELVVPETGTWRAPEAERGVEVLAHHGVLELSPLGEQVRQLFPALHEDGRLSRHGEEGIAGLARLSGVRSRPNRARLR